MLFEMSSQIEKRAALTETRAVLRKADAAWAKLDGDAVYGGVSRRTVKR